MEKIKFILKSLSQTLNNQDNELSYEKAIKGVVKNKIYKIIPKRIKLFSEELFGDIPPGEEPVLEL